MGNIEKLQLVFSKNYLLNRAITDYRRLVHLNFLTIVGGWLLNFLHSAKYPSNY